MRNWGRNSRTCEGIMKHTHNTRGITYNQLISAGTHRALQNANNVIVVVIAKKQCEDRRSGQFSIISEANEDTAQWLRIFFINYVYSATSLKSKFLNFWDYDVLC